MGKNAISCDKEFDGYLPRRTPDERAQLAKLILRDGCLTPLIGWEEEGLLVDGYERYAICLEHDVPFEIEWRSFPNRDAVKLFMLELQLGRRNVTDAYRSVLIGLRGLLEKQLAAYGEKGKVIQRLADKEGVSTRQIERDIATANHVQSLSDREGITQAEAIEQIKEEEALNRKIDERKKEPLVCSRCQQIGAKDGLTGCVGCAALRDGKKETKFKRQTVKPQSKNAATKAVILDALGAIRSAKKKALAILETAAAEKLRKLSISYGHGIMTEEKTAKFKLLDSFEAMLIVLSQERFNG